MASYREPLSTTETGTTSSGNGNLQGKTGETIEQAQQQAMEQLDQLQERIRRNPLAAAGIAAGLGFLLAVLARR